MSNVANLGACSRDLLSSLTYRQQQVAAAGVAAVPGNSPDPATATSQTPNGGDYIDESRILDALGA
jgi:hypothetical protein